MAKQNETDANAREDVESKESNQSGAVVQGGKKGSLKKRLFFLFLFLAVAAGAIFAYWYFNLRGFVSTDDAFIDGYHIFN